MGVLAEIGWITLDDGSIAHRFAAGSISVIALVSGLIFYAYTYRKWGPFLSNAKLDLHIIQDGSSHHRGHGAAGGGRGGGAAGGAGGSWRRPDGDGYPHGGAGAGAGAGVIAARPSA